MKGLRLIDIDNKSTRTDIHYQHIYIDAETGVNYIMTNGDEVCCPRYNADGSLYVTPKSELNRLLYDAENNGYNKRYIKREEAVSPASSLFTVLNYCVTGSSVV